MNGVDELTNKIIRAAIEVHRHFTMGIRRLVRELRNNLCDLRVLRGEYLTAIRARNTSFLRNPHPPPTCE